MFRESQSNDEVCRNRVLFLVSIFQLGIALTLPTLAKVKFSHVGIHETTEALSLRFLWTVLCLSLLRTVVFPFWHLKTPEFILHKACCSIWKCRPGCWTLVRACWTRIHRVCNSLSRSFRSHTRRPDEEGVASFPNPLPMANLQITTTGNDLPTQESTTAFSELNEEKPIGQSENRADMGECTLCYSRERNKALIKCGHALCQDCGEQLMMEGNICPWCREPIIGLNPVFLP